MKKSLCIFLSALIIVILSSCSSQQANTSASTNKNNTCNITASATSTTHINKSSSNIHSTKPTETNVKNILTEVLKSEKMFITQTGKKVYLKNHLLGEGVLATPTPAYPTEYVFIDFDGDSHHELLVNVNNEYATYLVLRYNDSTVYGYEFGIRSLQNLKIDGSFSGSGGAATHYYSKMTFVSNTCKIINIAVKDDMGGVYELNGKSCSVSIVNKYITTWNKKENVVWTPCNVPHNTISKHTTTSSHNKCEKCGKYLESDYDITKSFLCLECYANENNFDYCSHCNKNTVDAKKGVCIVCNRSECPACHGPITKHNCDDYPNIFCPNCDWKTFETGVGIDGITCPKCGTRCL
ncbi:MAG: hypothetical protein IIW03_03895 [Clostridia bacterium]|nr:hypothetical protein [Clostridia bacterium]